MEYVLFFVALAAICAFCPAFLGFVIGVGAFCVIWFVFYKLLGGS
jgi:hypothetical protein